MARSDSAIVLKNQIIEKLLYLGIPKYDPQELEAAEHKGVCEGAKAELHWREIAEGKLVAVKFLKRGLEEMVAEVGMNSTEQDAKRKRLFQYFERECVLWHRGSSESDDPRSLRIVRLLGFAPSYGRSIFPALVMEYYDGNLRNLVCTESLSEREKLVLLRDVALGLAYLHEPHLMIVHRDIKGKNILVHKRNGAWSAAIGDFGSAKLGDNQVFPIVNSSFSGTLAWTPPEYIVNGREQYSNPTIFGDVWSFGCTVLEIMSKLDPWNNTNDYILHLAGDLTPHHPPRPHCFDENSNYWELVLSCFQLHPEERPTGRILETRLRRILEEL